MKKIILLSLLLLTLKSHAQSSLSEGSPIAPVSPSIYEFMKYSEIPVSEYTGIPNIGIPLYTITDEHITIPININYHAGGFKVSEEASNIGLGWNMHFGTITQIVNDADDYGTREINGQTFFYDRKMPDYHGSPVTTDFPMRKTPPWFLDGAGWYTPYPIYNPQAMHSFKVASDYYFPVNGDFDTRQTSMCIDYWVDSEPDVFIVNFFGHSFKFMVNIDLDGNREIVILNNEGYYIEAVNSKTTNFSWKIITPDGNQFYFEEKSEVLNELNTTDGGFSQGGNPIFGPQQRVWYITKIITPKLKEIHFNYTQTNWQYNFPSVSQKYYWEKSKTYSSNITKSYFNGFSDWYPGLSNSYSINKEKLVILNSINFPEGNIFFSYSDRLDINGAKKLDQVVVKNSLNQEIKKIDFHNSYFISNNLGNSYSYVPVGLYTTSEVTHRLKLDSVTVNNSEEFKFKYNSTLLPNKFSFAVDYWEYYNGNLSNTSFVPNPSRFNRADISGTNNKSARLDYAKACILEEITYPTGGFTQFEYELNTFNNYWVPDYSNTNNTISNGNGLRVKSIGNFSNIGTLSTKKIYEYENGISFQPLSFFTDINFNKYSINNMSYYSIIAVESNNSFGFSPSPFGSGSGVGYSKVTVKNVDANLNALSGKIVKLYSNNADVIINSANAQNTARIVLPSRKNELYLDNGTLLTEEIYDQNNNLKKKITLEYFSTLSDIYYGAKLIPFGSYTWYSGDSNGQLIYNMARTLIGYYPIYDFNKLLKSKNTVEYFESNSIISNESFSYDSNNLLKTNTIKNSFGENLTTSYYYPNDVTVGSTIKNSITQSQYDAIYKMKWDYLFPNEFARIGELIQKEIKKNGSILNTQRVNFTILNNKMVLPEYIQDKKKSEIFKNQIFYHQYDDKGNPTEVSKKDGTHIVYIWGYQQTQPIAKIENATYAQVSGYVSNLQTLSNADNDRTINEGALQTALNNLRTVLTNSMVTTFTYDPLIGVTSITDPLGQTVYYHYDNSNRLEYILDKDGKVISKNEYHYKN